MMKRRNPVASTASLIRIIAAGIVILGTAIVADDTLGATQESKATQQAVPTQATAASHPQSSKHFEMDDFLKDYSTAISILFSVVGGIITYRVNEDWKRRQYVEEKVKDFEEKIESINVRKLLSSELRCIELFPFEAEPKHRYVIVKDCLWAQALLECKCNIELEKEYSLINKNKPLYEQEAAVKAVTRDNFNRFLDYLQQFEKMIESGVISKKSLENYLAPWLDLISRVNGETIVVCSVSQKPYNTKKALLEYMGLLESLPETNLSIVQKDVRALVQRYRTLSSLMSEKTPQVAEEEFSPDLAAITADRCPNPITAPTASTPSQTLDISHP